jgi:hypothetical protein
MTLVVNHKFLKAALVAGLMMILMSPTAGATGRLSDPEGWIDKLTGFVLVTKGIEKEGNFDPYLDQLTVVRSVFRTEWKRGELYDTYAGMNHFMDMLEAREGGIRVAAAEAIWNWCYQFTPIALHDVERHRAGFTPRQSS